MAQAAPVDTGQPQAVGHVTLAASDPLNEAHVVQDGLDPRGALSRTRPAIPSPRPRPLGLGSQQQGPHKPARKALTCRRAARTEPYGWHSRTECQPERASTLSRRQAGPARWTCSSRGAESNLHCLPGCKPGTFRSSNGRDDIGWGNGVRGQAPADSSWRDLVLASASRHSIGPASARRNSGTFHLFRVASRTATSV